MEDSQFKIRLPGGLRDRLEQEAIRSSRSLTAEIVHRLEASFPFIEGELLERRFDESRRVLDEVARSTAEYMNLQDQLRSMVTSLGIENGATDARTQPIHARMLLALERTEFLEKLYERCDADLQFLRDRVSQVVSGKDSQQQKSKTRARAKA